MRYDFTNDQPHEAHGICLGCQGGVHIYANDTTPRHTFRVVVPHDETRIRWTCCEKHGLGAIR